MNAIGRPPLSEHERRSKQAKIRLTIAEHAHVSAQARAAGMSLAEFVRRRTLGEPVQPRASMADAKLLTELNAIGVNLNQIARNLNAERHSRHTSDLPALQARLNRVLSAVVEVLT